MSKCQNKLIYMLQNILDLMSCFPRVKKKKMSDLVWPSVWYWQDVKEMLITFYCGVLRRIDNHKFKKEKEDI